MRTRRRGQRGQVLPIIALAGVVLIGATALAVDLSLQTNAKRQLQNASDAAALAGGRDLYASGSTLSPADQSSAVADAMAAVAGNMGWSVDLTAQPGYGDCSGYPTAAMNIFGLSGLCKTVTYNDDTITVSTPPASPSNPIDLDTHDVQVDISQSQSTNFAAVIGFGSASEKGHAVARHGAAGVTVGFALFSNQYIQTGNSISIVDGNVYAGRAVDLQASGASAFCANTTGTADDGYIVLGAPQTGDSLPAASTVGQSGVKPTTSQQITALNPVLATPCTVDDISTAKLGGYVIQAGSGVQPPSQTCPSFSGSGPAFYNTTVKACEVTPIVLPPAPPPPTPATANVVTYDGTSPCKTKSGPQCWKTAPADGIYIVKHAPTCKPTSCFDVQIISPMTLGHVTIWLEPGATFGINLGASGGAVTVAGPYDAGTGQPGDAHYVIYGQSGSQFQVVGGKTPVTFTSGSIFMPSGTVSCSDSTAALTLLSGQAVADTWNVSSGNQKNPQITYDGRYAAVTSETLRLVE